MPTDATYAPAAPAVALPDTALPRRQAALRPARTVVALLCLATLAGCASFSGILPSAKPIDAQTLGLNNPAATPGPTLAPMEPENTWWTTLGDDQLQRLVQQALDNSPGLRLTQARLERAQAASAGVASESGLQVNGELDLQRQLFSANSLYPPPYGGSEYENGTLQLNASWELDFFGRNRAALDAALGQERASAADARAARSLLASRVATTYYQLVRLQAQSALAQRTLELREQTRKLVQERVQAGLDTSLELRQSEGGLPDARLQLEMLSEQKALALNALAALTAQPASSLQLSVPPLESLHPATPLRSLPLDLLGRRDDIAAARWRVQAASQDVAAAKSAFYPNIDLVAFAGFSSFGFNKLVESSSAQWGVGPAIRLPLFDAGRLRAQLRGKTADLDAAVESYNSQVLEAIHESTDQITSAQAIARQQAEQAAAQSAAEAAYRIAQQRYQAGLGNYLQVLSAEAPLLAQQRQGVDLAARALQTQVLVLHALGGSVPATP